MGTGDTWPPDREQDPRSSSESAVLPSTGLSQRKPRRLRRWLVAIGLGLVLLVGTGIVVLRLKFNGPALADQIETMLNRRMRGRIQIGSIEWPAHGLTNVVTGGWVPVTIRDVTVWDRRADERTRDCFTDKQVAPPRRVLQAPSITAEVDVHALMFGRHDMVFRHVVINGGHVRLEQSREPYPQPAHDKTIGTPVPPIT